VHTNLRDAAGIVVDFKSISADVLPEEIRDIVSFSDVSTILVEEPVSERRFVVITSQRCEVGDIIEVSDEVIHWRVNWHEYHFFERSFEEVILGDVAHLDRFESNIESLLAHRFGGVLFPISKADFFFGALFILMYLVFYLQKRFYIWNILLILSLYSFEVFLSNFFANRHDMVVEETSKYFGYAFFVFIPTMYLLWGFEKSETGEKRIKELWNEILK
jgi:hypothetical protein